MRHHGWKDESSIERHSLYLDRCAPFRHRQKVNCHTYKYRFGLGQFFNLLIGFGLLGGSIFLLLRFNVDSILVVVSSFLALFGLTPILLTMNYLTRSLHFEILIDQDRGIFEITRKEGKQICNLKDVTSVDIYEQKDIGLYGFDFDFAKYTFVDGKYCIVTNMMADDYYIPVGLQPRIRRRMFPIIWSMTIG